MPAKSLCPNCGQKYRSPAHICMPTSVGKMERRRKALSTTQSK